MAQSISTFNEIPEKEGVFILLTEDVSVSDKASTELVEVFYKDGNYRIRKFGGVPLLELPEGQVLKGPVTPAHFIKAAPTNDERIAKLEAGIDEAQTRLAQLKEKVLELKAGHEDG